MQKVALVQASVWSVPSRNPSFSGSGPTFAGFVQALPSQVAMTSSPIAAQNRAAAQDVELIYPTPACRPADHVSPSQTATPSPAMQKVALGQETV
jgi:hypothetical protein